MGQGNVISKNWATKSQKKKSQIYTFSGNNHEEIDYSSNLNNQAILEIKTKRLGLFWTQERQKYRLFGGVWSGNKMYFTVYAGFIKACSCADNIKNCGGLNENDPCRLKFDCMIPRWWNNLGGIKWGGPMEVCHWGDLRFQKSGDLCLLLVE